MPRKPPKPPEITAQPRFVERGKNRPRSLRHISRERLEAGELEVLNEELQRTSDRGAALLLIPIVEQMLEQLIEQHLKRRENDDLAPLYERDGALSTFFAKTHLGYSLGLYDVALRNDLEVLRRVRNVFAHARRPINFGPKEISDECKKLKTADDPKHAVRMVMEDIFKKHGK